ncbi:Alpha/Beta hydrolase protein [Powellomyces hirtus]|nr:Alpha/Beta hydrolase protein [Powellomyces hirtus]
MVFRVQIALVAVASFLPSAVAAPTPNPSSQTATVFNLKSAHTFTNNIRYPAPPTGARRFATPASPTPEVGIDLGLTQTAGRIQMLPFGASPAPGLGPYPTSEDCLFLDVVVPALRFGEALPVAFWIHCGGNAFGSKNDAFYSAAQIEHSANNSLIYVKINYGKSQSYTVAQQAATNVGLLDQRAALQWVQKYIGLVNGDKTRVAAFGESTGCGAIIHHLAAKGGLQDPRDSAIARIQGGLSGEPTDHCVPADKDGADCGGWPDCTKHRTDGPFAFAPATDGTYLTEASPSPTLGFKPMPSSNHAPSLLPQRNHRRLNQMLALYPPPSPATAPQYLTQTLRLAQLIAESTFSCNVRALSGGLACNTYNYIFAALPGIHTQDWTYTYYAPGAPPMNLLDASQARFQRRSLIHLKTRPPHLAFFMLTGNPNIVRQFESTPPSVPFCKVGAGLVFNALTTPADQCAFWIAGFYTGRCPR